MSTPMQILPEHHRHCDELFAAAEEAALNGDWDAAVPAFERFNAQMIAHFDAEETLRLIERYRVDSYLSYYRFVKRRFLEQMEAAEALEKKKKGRKKVA